MIFFSNSSVAPQFSTWAALSVAWSWQYTGSTRCIQSRCTWKHEALTFLEVPESRGLSRRFLPFLPKILPSRVSWGLPSSGLQSSQPHGHERQRVALPRRGHRPDASLVDALLECQRPSSKSFSKPRVWVGRGTPDDSPQAVEDPSIKSRQRRRVLKQ